MKTKLIQTEKYLLLIDEEAEVCRGQYRLLNDKVELIHEGHNYPYKGFKIIAYYPLTKEAKELDLPWLPNPFEKKCTEQIVAEFCRNSENVNYNNIKDKVHLTFLQEDMILLYNQAQSNKQFSLEDMKKAIRMAKKGYDEFEENGFLRHCFDFSEIEIIQSLSSQQLPVSFEPEYEPEYWGARNIFNPDSIDFKIFSKKEKEKYLGAMFDYHPKKLKTIINSEDKEEIQGTYKY